MLPALLTTLVWLYLAVGRGFFWRVRTGGAKAAAPARWPRVAVIIPARNEAEVIGQAVRSVLAQDYPGEMHVFVVDDHSTDSTAAAAGRDARLSVIPARALPQGWTGKVWAMSPGVEAAAAFEPEGYLFTDADIVHSPDNLRGLAAREEDVASLMVKLHCETFAERALIPAFVYFFFQLYPPAWGTGAAGGCLLIRRQALESAGGLAAIRGDVIDDCALARAVRRSGGRVWLGMTATTRSIRPYGGFSGIGQMISRTAFTQLRYSPLLLAGTVAGLVITYLLPPALASSGEPFAAAAWILMAATYIPMLRFYSCSLMWAPALPLVAAFYLGATVHSAIQYWRGRGGAWKGRSQAPKF